MKVLTDVWLQDLSGNCLKPKPRTHTAPTPFSPFSAVLLLSTASQGAYCPGSFLAFVPLRPGQKRINGKLVGRFCFWEAFWFWGQAFCVRLFLGGFGPTARSGLSTGTWLRLLCHVPIGGRRVRASWSLLCSEHRISRISHRRHCPGTLRSGSLFKGCAGFSFRVLGGRGLSKCFVTILVTVVSFGDDLDLV